MSGKFSHFRSRHPALIEALIWAIPAVAIGLAVRVLLSILQPYAYYGSDSESYFSFTYRLLTDDVASIPEKRRYVYPLLLLPAGILPGGALRWIVGFQHLLGLVTILPLAYIARKVFVKWRWWIIPVSVSYAVTPIVVWYEHELLGETFFFMTFVWAFAAWVAWSGRLSAGQPAQFVWWCFFVSYGLCVLTKPAGRFLWPGLVIGFLAVRVWRWMRWWQWVALAGLFVMSWTLGKGTQASRLLYTSAFPLTQLDTPKHAELKAEIAPLVGAARDRIDWYYLEDDGAKEFLRNDYRSKAYPAWRALHKVKGDPEYEVMRELALEGIFAEPHLFLYIALQRTVGSMNWAVFKEERFESEYYPRKFEGRYAEIREEPGMVEMLFGWREVEPAPEYPEIAERLVSGQNPALQSWQNAWVNGAIAAGKFVQHPTQDGFARTLWQMTPTLQGWLLLVGGICCVAVSRFRNTLGIWVLIAGSYAVGVHLVGSCNPRFFALVWPVVFLAMAAPLDWIGERIGRFSKQYE